MGEGTGACQRPGCDSVAYIHLDLILRESKGGTLPCSNQPGVCARTPVPSALLCVQRATPGPTGLPHSVSTRLWPLRPCVSLFSPPNPALTSRVPCSTQSVIHCAVQCGLCLTPPLPQAPPSPPHTLPTVLTTPQLSLAPTTASPSLSPAAPRVPVPGTPGSLLRPAWDLQPAGRRQTRGS